MVARSHGGVGQNGGRPFEASGPVPYILRVSIGPLYGIRVAFAHESRTFDLPGTTAGHPADIPLEAVEHSVGHVGRTP